MKARVMALLAGASACSLIGVGIAGAVPKSPAGDLSAPRSTTAIGLDENGLGVVNFGASTSSATKTFTAKLGTPTGHPSAGCTRAYSQTAWHDLIVQFKSGRFTGYRYIAGGWSGISPSTKTLHAAVTPKLAASTRITLGSTMAAAKHAYPSLRQTGSDFWSTPTGQGPPNQVSGIVFAFYSLKATSSASEPIYEIKNNVCPGSL